MTTVTTIVVRGDDLDETRLAVCLALVSWQAGLLGVLRDEPLDDSDETCERVLAWLRRDESK